MILNMNMNTIINQKMDRFIFKIFTASLATGFVIGYTFGSFRNFVLKKITQ